MKYRPVTKIIVSLVMDNQPICVGRLALIKRSIYFEYDHDFLKSGIEISPFMLPRKAGTFHAKPEPFEGLFGVFNDSLPDGWGRLLLDRSLKSHGISPEDLSPLDRLTHVGSNGMGALAFEPDVSIKKPTGKFLDLAQLAEETTRVLAGETEEVFQELLDLTGSSAGARPKVMVGVATNKQQITHGHQELPDGFEHWLIKFGSQSDPAVMGEGQSPGRSPLLLLAKKIGIKPKRANAIVDEVADAVSNWKTVADEVGVRKSSIRSIEAGMRTIK
jgi:serine/threonine-protein kinase HipA